MKPKDRIPRAGIYSDPLRYYKLSGDKRGLIAHCKQPSGKKFTYHIHSNELTDLEKWIKKLLLRNSKEVIKTIIIQDNRKDGV